ncbi:hypothetical protein [Segetibacter sp.]|jgi:hypothetical protein|uniref:hypothetical protein n=1 Tax=Segetibacter sp. TaxID=2231182 RepID=UPI002626C3D5|nr:hypothetical protein [Segetibacter sp.]MCW3081286.1 hypothetical protein [Segetibacter sp.]
MKQVLSTILLLWLTSNLSAQPEMRRVELSNYVFPDFVEGTVKQKSGEINKALLNYNSLTEEMIFDQAGQKLALDKTGNIDTVYILNRKFIPFGNIFYEVATNTPTALMIQHKTEVIPPGSNTGFGTSQTAAISNITDLKRAGSAYKLKLPDEYQLAPKTAFWLKRNNNYYAIKREKDFEDLFSDKADEIKKYVKANKIKFNNMNDLIKVTLYSN